MPTINLYGLTLDTADYTNSIITSDGGTTLDPLVWVSTVTPTIVAGSGINVNITLVNTSTGNQLAQHYFKIVNGFTTSALPKPSSYYWVADNITKRWPSASGSSASFQWGRDGEYPFNFKVPFYSLDDGVKISTVSENYMMPMEMIGGFNGTKYTVDVIANRSANGDNNFGRAPVDWYAPGETRSFNFYIRVASGVSPSSFIETVDPYARWYRQLFPYNHPPKMSGRIYGYNISQNEQSTTILATGDNSRKYWGINPVTRRQPLSANTFDYPNYTAATCTGFASLIPAIVPDKLLKQNGYGGVLFWGIAGLIGDGYDFRPNIITTLPPNLSGSLGDIATWSQRHGLDFYFWAGTALGTYQVTASGWDSISYTSLASGYYFLNAGTFTELQSAGKWKIKPEADREIKLNSISGYLKYTNGAGLDACPQVSTDPWVTGYLSMFRQMYPNARFGVESTLEDISLNYCPNIYFDHTTFHGRCAFMDTVTPGYQPWVIINFFLNFDNPIHYQGTGTLEDARRLMYDRVLDIESQGGIVIIAGGYDAIIPTTGLIDNNFHYFESIDFTNKPIIVNNDIRHIPKISNSPIINSDYSVNLTGLQNVLSPIWNSGYTAVAIELTGVVRQLDVRNNGEATIDRALNALATGYFEAKRWRADIDWGYFGLLREVSGVINYQEYPNNTSYASGYNSWVRSVQRLNYRASGSIYLDAPFYRYNDIIFPDIYALEGNSLYARNRYDIWAGDNVAKQISILSGTGSIPVYPFISAYFEQLFPFQGKPLSGPSITKGINACRNNNANGVVLYANNPSQFISEFRFAVGTTGVANWQAVSGGSFTSVLAGTPFPIANLDFTSVATHADIASLIRDAINNEVNDIAITDGSLPIPYSVGSVDVSWVEPNILSFTLASDTTTNRTAVYNNAFPPDNAYDRSYFAIKNYAVTGNIDISSTGYIGASSGTITYSNLRDSNEWNNYATPYDWWITYVNGGSPFIPGDNVGTLQMWPDTMWPTTMWTLGEWPIIYRVTIDLGIGHTISFDTNFISNVAVGNIDLISMGSLDINLIGFTNQNIDLIETISQNIVILSILTFADANIISNIDLDANMNSTISAQIDLAAIASNDAVLVENKVFVENLEQSIVSDLNIVTVFNNIVTY